jgi:calcineurin-like phosphoesterase family protein
MRHLRPTAVRTLVCVLALVCCRAAERGDQSAPPSAVPAPQASLPNKPDSLKFAVIGDNGTGDAGEYELAKQMAEWHDRFPYAFVVMVGDNIYGSERPQDFVKKFEQPYKALLDAGVKFYASLGNHDSREQRYYKLYNMDGRLYYSFKAPKQDVKFFAFESTYMDGEQLKWIETELKDSREKWKICFFHHPLYSSGKTHGSEVKLRSALEPLLLEYSVSLVLNGHDHIYERIVPQNGIQYFVTGSGGQLRDGDLQKNSPLTARGNDTDQVFMMMEINGDDCSFAAVSRAGRTVDSGSFSRRSK